MKKIAIFASGNGTNAKKIIDHFKKSGLIKVSLLVCNNPNAGVLKIAAVENITVLLIEKSEFQANGYIKELNNNGIDFIVLAGFLWKLPAALVKQYPRKIINIHPALLPAYGGKGMYGNAVHDSVIKAGEKQSGITIHYVDEIYDHGDIIFQATCPVDEEDTAESLAQKIHSLEHRHYPAEIERLLNDEPTKLFIKVGLT
ncbi:MAG: phosphoribosylglycinamide formyltransferase [Bacteroidota bacterium]|nr:phosphoribosylglycinamide formyltransferase [Bacteroidota bacterium]